MNIHLFERFLPCLGAPYSNSSSVVVFIVVVVLFVVVILFGVVVLFVVVLIFLGRTGRVTLGGS